MKPSPFLIAGTLAFAVPVARAAPGNAEPGFNPNVDGQVSSIALQPDGKLLVGGFFNSVGGVFHPNIVRLNADGALDSSFNPQGNEAVLTLGVMADGRILLGGDFSLLNGVARTRMARLNADGSLDEGFVMQADESVRSTVFLPDGKVLFGGLFTSVNTVSRAYLVRVNGGTLESEFNPGFNGVVRIPLLQPDGKIVVGGNFSSVGGTGRSRMARLNADGTLDTAFNPNVTGTGVYCAALQPDGKIVIGGSFTAVGGISRLNVARLNADGSLDTGFNPGANEIVRGIILQTDGKMICTGAFTSFGGSSRGRIARLNAAGTLDTGFNPSANNIIFGSVIQPDGKVVVGGDLTFVGGASRNHLARLENDPATESLTVPSPSRVQWLRGGASPETHQVSFELSIDGGAAWTAAGAGTRIEGGWDCTGLTLPFSGLIRARARVHGGYGTGSAGLVESVTSYNFTPLQRWRQAHFGTMENSGDAGDNADPDADGLENLIEFAFGLDPAKGDASFLPAWERDDDDLILSFSQPEKVRGVTYMVEQSPSLAPGDWTAVPNAAVPPEHTYYLPADAGLRRYLRIRVTAP